MGFSVNRRLECFAHHEMSSRKKLDPLDMLDNLFHQAIWAWVCHLAITLLGSF